MNPRMAPTSIPLSTASDTAARAATSPSATKASDRAVTSHPQLHMDVLRCALPWPTPLAASSPSHARDLAMPPMSAKFGDHACSADARAVFPQALWLSRLQAPLPSSTLSDSTPSPSRECPPIAEMTTPMRQMSLGHSQASTSVASLSPSLSPSPPRGAVWTSSNAAAVSLDLANKRPRLRNGTTPVARPGMSTSTAKRCSVADCCKIAVSKGLCRGHGGGRRCTFDGCTKCAQSRSPFCWAHGGGKRCEAPNCRRSRKSKHFCVDHLFMEPGFGQDQVDGAVVVPVPGITPQLPGAALPSLHDALRRTRDASASSTVATLPQSRDRLWPM